MAAIRVDIVPLRPKSLGAATPFLVHLDCWRATVRISTTEAGQWAIDGVDVYTIFAAAGSPGGGFPPAPNFFSLGGLVVQGQPVNLNHQLKFSPISGGISVDGVVILEYWDLQLPDPQNPNR